MIILFVVVLIILFCLIVGEAVYRTLRSDIQAIRGQHIQSPKPDPRPRTQPTETVSETEETEEKE